MKFVRLALSAALISPLGTGIVTPSPSVSHPSSTQFASAGLVPVANSQLQPFLLAQKDDTAESDEGVINRPTLAPGSNGPLVIELQLRLQAIGLYEGEINGDFSEATRLAVGEFQSEYGLEPTGTVGPETWQALANPATAKLEAALEADETSSSSSGNDENTNEAEAGSEATESETSDSKRSPLNLAIIAAAIAGLGLGGFGLWKAVGPKRRKKPRALKPRRQATQPLLASAPLPRPPEAPQKTPPQQAGVSSAPLPTDGAQVAGQQPSIADPWPESSSPNGAEPEGEQSEQSDAEVIQPKAENSLHRSGPSLLRQQRLLTPPPPPSAIEHVGNNPPLSPTTRLTRQDVVETLIAHLQSNDPTQRRKAVWELGQRGDSRAIQPLVNLMAVSDSKQRSLILAALSEIGSQTLKPMKRALALSLQDSNAEVRKNAIRDLTRIYDLVAQISNLLAIATEDEDPEVRDTARWALGQLNRIRSNAGLDQPANQQLLQNSVSPPETLSDDLQLDSRSRETELN